MEALAPTPSDTSALLRARIGPARGRPPSAKFQMSIVRELTESDIQDLINTEHGAIGAGTPPIQRIRATHHALARLLGEGKKQVEAAAILGFSQSRISILAHDPAFQELIEFYRGQAQAKYLDVHERLADLGVTAVEELRDRLEEKPDTFSNRELLEITDSMMDRTVAPNKTAKAGFGNTSGPPAVNVSINFVKNPNTPAQISGTVIDG